MQDPHMPPGVSEWDVPGDMPRDDDGPDEPIYEPLRCSQHNWERRRDGRWCSCCGLIEFGVLVDAPDIPEASDVPFDDCTRSLDPPHIADDADKWLTTSLAILECEDVMQLQMVIRLAERRIEALKETNR